jgi:TonB family protein
MQRTRPGKRWSLAADLGVRRTLGCLGEREVSWSSDAQAVLTAALVISAWGGCAQRTVAPAPKLVESGAQGSRLGPLFFDPLGADYASWLNHFKNQVYRNWEIPQEALRGAQGHSDVEFTVQRSGSLSQLRISRSSGSSQLDQAAEAALRNSRFEALPETYPESQVTMKLTFFYNEPVR